MSSCPYVLDSAAPHAPTEEQWREMGEHAREQVLTSLPSELPRTSPPEGDAHRIPKTQALETLDEHFRRTGRRVYLSSELPVYYPGEAVFAPDLIAVLDVPSHPRQKWVVSHEGKGLDVVLEIHVSGSREKDFELNVARFARLGIPEYFVFDPSRSRLLGYRLGAPGTYEAIVPQGGRWVSRVLGLDLALEGSRLRFYYGAGPLPDARELLERVSAMVDDATARAEREAEHAAREAERAQRLAAKLREFGVDPDSSD